MIADYRWLWQVDGCKMFLHVMVRRYCIFDFQNLSIARSKNEKISKYKDKVTLGRIGHQGGRSSEMGAQAMGLYRGKYGPEILVGEETVKANIFANRFIVKSRKYPRDFWVEGWIYGPTSHWRH